MFHHGWNVDRSRPSVINRWKVSAIQTFRRRSSVIDRVTRLIAQLRTSKLETNIDLGLLHSSLPTDSQASDSHVPIAPTTTMITIYSRGSRGNEVESAGNEFSAVHRKKESSTIFCHRGEGRCSIDSVDRV